MGIGLSVCKSIVERFRGRLWATQNDGPEATFHFLFDVSYYPENTSPSKQNVRLGPERWLNLLDDDVGRYLGVYQYQGSIDFP